MQVITARSIAQQATRNTDPHVAAGFLTKMRADLEAIKRVREAYNQLGVNERFARKRGGATGRRLASLPRPIYLMLAVKYPEILQNINLMKQWLRDNEGYLLVDKSRL